MQARKKTSIARKLAQAPWRKSSLRPRFEQDLLNAAHVSSVIPSTFTPGALATEVPRKLLCKAQAFLASPILKSVIPLPKEHKHHLGVSFCAGHLPLSRIVASFFSRETIRGSDFFDFGTRRFSPKQLPHN